VQQYNLNCILKLILITANTDLLSSTIPIVTIHHKYQKSEYETKTLFKCLNLVNTENYTLLNMIALFASHYLHCN